MGKFKEIDLKIEKLAIKLGAKLTKDRPDYPEVLRTFEERRIDWIHDDISKAIIIQPNFEIKGVNSKIWNFINIAWLDDGKSIKKLQWLNILVDKKPFKFIESNIDYLLFESEKSLSQITISDLEEV